MASVVDGGRVLMGLVWVWAGCAALDWLIVAARINAGRPFGDRTVIAALTTWGAFMLYERVKERAS